MTGKGGVPYDDAPRDPIYVGAEPIPDTPMLIEQALAELRQAEIGLWYVGFIEMHYCNFNRPTHIKLNLMKEKIKRRINKDDFYEFARRGREFAQYELQQLTQRGPRQHKALKRGKKTVVADENS